MNFTWLHFIQLVQSSLESVAAEHGRIGGRNPMFAENTNDQEGANREKLTVKKIINNEMFFFHRLCPL